MKTSTKLLLVLAAAFGANAFGAEFDTIVKIDSGYISGSGGAVRSYKGIPFAAPPVGDLRFKAPQPVKPWTSLRVAKRFSAACPQPAGLMGQDRVAEDCLSINVWTNARVANDKLPVLVWIYGGAYEIGAAGTSAYDGTALASQGVVVVSFNYRLGIFGFLSHPELSKESLQNTSGNQGLLDTVAALQWVQRNIGAFGGDPHSVTIWGESAGATSVALLMVMPSAQGLFSKAVANSIWSIGTPIAHVRDSWSGRLSGEEYGKRFGTLAELRAKTMDDLVKLAGAADLAGNRTRRGEVFNPAVDGAVLPDDPWLLFRQGKFARVPLLAGTTADEGSMFSPRLSTLAQANDWLRDYVAPQAVAPLLQAYGVSDDAQAQLSVAKINGDMMFAMGTRAILRAAAKANADVYQYEFTRASGVGKRIRLNAFHGSDIGYWFGTMPDSPFNVSIFTPFPTDYDAHDESLSRAMTNSLVRFVKTGNPNGTGMPKWPAYRDAEQYLEFGNTIAVKQGLQGPQLDALDKVFEPIRADMRPR